MDNQSYLEDMLRNRILFMAIFFCVFCSCGYNYPNLDKQCTMEIVITDAQTNTFKRITNPTEINKTKDVIAKNVRISQKFTGTIDTCGFNGIKLLFISNNDTVFVLFKYSQAKLYYQQENYWVYSDVCYETGRFLEELLWEDDNSGIINK